jgi:hypothetical protein
MAPAPAAMDTTMNMPAASTTASSTTR